MLPGGVVSGRPNPLHFGLPARLKKARKAARLTRQRLSLMAGLANGACHFIEERGTIPHIDTIEKLANALKLSPCVLAYGIQGPFIPSDTLHSARVGTRLRQAREARGSSKKALGVASGTTGQTVRNIEDRQAIPSIATAEQLATALDVSPCWLAFGAGELDPP